MAEMTFAPTTVIDTSKIIDPILQNQMQKIAFAKSQVENMQSGVASIAKSLGQIKMAGTQNDQLSMQQMMNKLRDDWTAANVKYQGNIPIQEQVKYQGALSQLNQMADLYAADKKEVDRYEKDFTKMFVAGNVSPESYERFRADLVARQSRPVWERQPLNYANYVDPKAKTENNSFVDLIAANKYEPDLDKKDGSQVIYDVNKSRDYFKKLIQSDAKAKSDFESVMALNGLNVEDKKDVEKGLGILVETHKMKFGNTINDDSSKNKDGYDYEAIEVAPTIPPVGTPTIEALRMRTGYKEIPVVLTNVPYKGGKVNVVGVRTYPNGVSEAMVEKEGIGGIVKTELVPYDEISAGMLNAGAAGKRWTKKNEESIKSVPVVDYSSFFK